MRTSERWDALKAFANSTSSAARRCADCSGVYQTPKVAQTFPHNRTYSSIRAGTAGTLIWPSADNRRYSRLIIASRSIDGSNDLFGGSCTRTFYTTGDLCTTAATDGRRGYPHRTADSRRPAAAAALWFGVLIWVATSLARLR